MACVLAAKSVGDSGHVIGVDMTDAMLEKARANAEKGGYANVEFRKGEIEALPVDDNSIDVITSNCVINLSPEKAKVFSEAYRVLKPGGRAFISDIVLLKPLPESIAESVAAYTACVGGAILKDDYIAAMTSAGFAEANITSETPLGGRAENIEEGIEESGWLQGLENASKEDLIEAAASVVSIKVELRK